VPGGPTKSSSSPRDWRAQSRPTPRSTGGKYAGRIVLTLLAAGLGGVLAYVLYHLVPAGIHFAVLPVSDSDVLTLPPIPYSRENGDSLRDLDLHPPVLDLHDIQTADAMGTLAGKLREGLQKSDSLIVYLTGNCISDAGPDGPAAWLLCSDYSVFRETGGTESKPAGRYRLRDVLGQMKQCSAKSKLLVLDTGYLNYDPRLGLFVNEFPRLLEEDVKAVNDPDLWVLCSCRTLESSHVCGPEKRSVFNYFVMQGFTGAASTGSRWVELDHLFGYVRDHVAGWVERESGGAETQTPWLLHCGDADKPPKDSRLVPVLSRKPPPKPAEGDAAAEGTPKQPAKPSPAAVLNSTLVDAWQRRDRLQDRMLSRGGWTLVDYAPHLWREYQELLLGIDRRSRAGGAFDPAGLTNEIGQDLALDEKLFLDASGTSPAVSAAAASGARMQNVASRLMAARAQFLERIQGDSYFADGNPLRAAIQFKNDLMMLAPYYVRWNVAAGRSSGGHGPLDQELAKMLPMLAALVGSLEQAQAATTPAPPAAALREINDSVEAIKDSQRAIEQAIEDKIKALEQHSDAPAIETLLDTPLPTAAARKRLLAARDKVTDKLPGDAPPKPAATTAPVLWTSNVRQQADLEKQLVMLAAPEFHSASLDMAAESSANASAPRASDDRFWHTYRQFGQDLGGLYRGLPESIRKEIASGDSSAADRCDRLLRLVDARDAKNVPEEVLAVVLPHRRATPAPTLAVRAEAPPAADADGQYLIKLVIDKKDLPATAGRINFEFQGSDIALTTADGKQTITPDDSLAVELTSDHTERTFKARAQVQTGAETPLAITVRCGEKTRQCSLRLTLPQTDVVLLRAYRLAGKLDGSTEPRQECENVLQFDQLVPQRLQPFPNRPTTYTFEMVNRSGLSKKLLVRTYALPEWFWDRNMNCRQACDVLARSATLLGESPIELAEIGKPQKLAFPAIKPPAKKSDEKPPEKPAGAEPPKPKIDVSAGLAMLICDAKNKEPEAKWLQLYSFTPLRPTHFLDPAVHYNADEGKLEIDVALPADRDIPPCSQKMPVRLTMEVRDAAGRPVNISSQAGEGLRGQTKALLYPARPRDVLYAPVRGNDHGAMQVELSVDDYPRAFLFDVGLNNAASLRDVWRIHITEPPRDPVRCFQPRETLPVKFQVDAPEDSFFSRGAHGRAEDSVLLEIFDEQHPEAGRSQTFYSDRKVTVELDEADTPGEMKATTKVEDFSTDVDAHGLENVVARVRAQVLRDRQPKDEDSLRVILDGRPPEFELTLASNRVVKGTDIHVDATVVRTLSDMVKFEYGFQGDAEKQFKDKAKRIDVRGHTASFTLPTKDLDAGEYTVLVRGENKAGNADFHSVKVEVVEPPPPMPNKPAASETITVRGTVKWGDDSPAAGVKVSIKQPPRSVRTDGAGRFSFADLPRGSYTVKAEGSTGGMQASGEAEADPGGGDVADAKIKLSSLKR
jgi:hypothetical protein